MALSEKQKQKKLAKKKNKRKAHIRALSSSKTSMSTATGYADFQIHECLMPENLFELGIGNVLVARRTPEGNIAASIFLLDVFCLGVKNAMFTVIPEHEYEQTKLGMIESNDRVSFENIHPSCAKKLIEGGAEYAKGLGFSSHPDYKNAKQIFGNIDADACPVKYSYGKDGKPCYISGPNESMNEVNKIVDKLSRQYGADGFEFMVMGRQTTGL